MVYSVRFDTVEIFLVPCFLASPVSVPGIMLRIGLIASLFVLFGAKSGKYYSRKRGKLMQLGKEMTVIAMGFHLIREKLQLLQDLVNI